MGFNGGGKLMPFQPFVLCEPEFLDGKKGQVWDTCVTMKPKVLVIVTEEGKIITPKESELWLNIHTTSEDPEYDGDGFPPLPGEVLAKCYSGWVKYSTHGKTIEYNLVCEPGYFYMRRKSEDEKNPWKYPRINLMMLTAEVPDKNKEECLVLMPRSRTSFYLGYAWNFEIYPPKECGCDWSYECYNGSLIHMRIVCEESVAERLMNGELAIRKGF